MEQQLEEQALIVNLNHAPSVKNVLDITEKASREILSIPIHENLRDDEVEKIMDVLSVDY